MNTDTNFNSKIYTYQFDKYVINTLLNNNNIYMKVIDSTLQDEYEGYTDIRDLNSPFGRECTFQVILNCLMKNNNSYVSSEIKDNYFIFKFTYLVQNFLETTFLIRLLKINKNIKSDKQLLDEYLNEYVFVLKELKLVTKKQEKEIDHLKKHIDIFFKSYQSSTTYFENIIKEQKTEINNLYNILDSIGNLDIKINKISTNKTINPIFIYLPMNSKEINLSYPSDIEKIKCFYCLEKLSLQTSYDNINFENKSVKYIIFNGGNIVSLQGIENLPNVEIIEFNHCEKLEDVKSHLINTKIKKIIFKKCGDNKKQNITSFCKAKNIELIYS